jgi:hypothetical protein
MATERPAEEAHRSWQQESQERLDEIEKELDEMTRRLEQDQKDLITERDLPGSPGLPDDFNEGPHLPGLG